MTLSIQLALAAIIFLAGLAAGIKFESGEVAKLKTQHATSALADEREARSTESRRSLNVQEAQNAATKRAQAARADADRTRTELERLRNDIAASGSIVPGESATACNHRADTVRVVLAECAGALVEMAGHADAQASSVKLLQDAWPK